MILTIGLAVPQWIVLMAPNLHVDELSTLAKLVSIAYPFGDVLLLAAALRLTLDGGKRGMSFHLIASAIVLLLLTDFVYGIKLLHGTYDGQLWLDLGWDGFYVLWGAAALHPSMRILDHGRPARSVLTRGRLALLTVASLIAPAVELLHDFDRRDWDMAVVTGAAIVLFGLVVVRMAGLMRHQERSMERERALARAGAALVAAGTRAELETVALTAAQELAGDERDRRAARRRPLHAGRPAGADQARRPGHRPGARARARRRCWSPPGSTIAERAVREILNALGHAGRPGLRARGADRGARAARRARRASRRWSSTRPTSSRCSRRTRRSPTSRPAIERVLGWTPEEVSGRRIDDLMDAGRGLAAAAVDRRRRGRAGGVADAGDHAGPQGRDHAPVRGPVHQPDARRGRGRHRAELARRQRAQGVRAPARPPGVPRPGHRPAEPRAVRRARAARDRPLAPRGRGAWGSSSSTSTTSRSSTTRSATRPATRCSRRWRSGWR